jgi:hypothetical protein
MFYPTWDNATSYPVGSIVSFNGLLYEATFYHNPASTLEPNVEMGAHPTDPIFLTQRSWIIYGALPAGYSPSPFVLAPHILIRQVDFNEHYDLSAQFAPGPYGDDQGISKQEYAGSINYPTTPCPAAKCVVSLSHLGGPIYGTNFQLVKTLYNPVLAPSGTYYIDGPSNPEGETNTLYVWWGIQSPNCFRRSVKLFADTGEVDGSGNPIIEEQTFTPTDNTYSVGPATPIEWFAPGNQSVTFSSLPGPALLNAFEIAGND